MGKKLKKYTGIIIAGGLLTFAVPAYAQRTVSMTPIQKVYFNEKVAIEGNTQLAQVTVRVKREDGKSIYIDVVKVENESFEASFRMPASEAYGMYTIEVGEGSSFSKIEFEYAPKDNTPQKPDQGGNPGTENKPDQGGNPGTENKPDQGGNPGTENKPDQGGNPGTENKPDQGGNPGTENKPDQGGNPGTENKPDQGGNPGTENKPDQGGNPGTENKPDQGGNLGTENKPDQGGNPGTENEPGQDSDSSEDSYPEQGETNSSANRDGGSGSIDKPIKIVATDLRTTQEEKITIGLQDKFVDSFKAINPRENIKRMEFVIKERETNPHDRAISLGLSVNAEAVSVNGKIPPVEIVVEHGLAEGKILEYLRLTYTDQYGTHIIHGAQCDSRYLRFKAEQLGDYKVQYYQEQFEDLTSEDPETRNIHILAAQGIINGVSQNSFAPHKNITRADYLLLLMRNLNLNTDEKYEETFRDIRPNAYYYEAVHAARALGIVNGKENNKFEPQEIITEKEMFIMTERALKVGGLLKPEEGFSYEVKNPSEKISRMKAAMIQFDIYSTQQRSTFDEDFIHYINAERV